MHSSKEQPFLLPSIEASAPVPRASEHPFSAKGRSLALCGQVPRPTSGSQEELSEYLLNE